MTYGEPEYEAVFISHYHLDLIEAIDKILDNVTIYVEETTKKLYDIICDFQSKPRVKVKTFTFNYVGQYVIDGKRHSVYQKKNKKVGDFKARFNKIIFNINDGTYIGKSLETLETIIERHIEQKNKDGITNANSYKRDKETLEQIKKCCSNFIYKPVQKVTLHDIENSKENMKRYKKSGIDRAWRLLFKGFRIVSSPSYRLIPYNIMDDENFKKPFSVKVTEKVII